MDQFSKLLSEKENLWLAVQRLRGEDPMHKRVRFYDCYEARHWILRHPSVCDPAALAAWQRINAISGLTIEYEEWFKDATPYIDRADLRVAEEHEKKILEISRDIAGVNHEPASSRSTGRPISTSQRVEAELIRDHQQGVDIFALKQIEMGERYRAAESTCRVARRKVKAIISGENWR